MNNVPGLRVARTSFLTSSRKVPACLSKRISEQIGEADGNEDEDGDEDSEQKTPTPWDGSNAPQDKEQQSLAQLLLRLASLTSIGIASFSKKLQSGVVYVPSI